MFNQQLPSNKVKIVTTARNRRRAAEEGHSVFVAMCTQAPSDAIPVPSTLRHKLIPFALPLFPRQERGGVLCCVHFLGSGSGIKGTGERFRGQRRPNWSGSGRPLFLVRGHHSVLVYRLVVGIPVCVPVVVSCELPVPLPPSKKQDRLVCSTGLVSLLSLVARIDGQHSHTQNTHRVFPCFSLNSACF